MRRLSIVSMIALCTCLGGCNREPSPQEAARSLEAFQRRIEEMEKQERQGIARAAAPGKRLR